MMNFSFTKQSVINPKVTIDISSYQSDDKSICMLNVDTYILGEEIRFVEIEGYFDHYEYNIREKNLKCSTYKRTKSHKFFDRIPI